MTTSPVPTTAAIDRDRLADTLSALIRAASVNPFGRAPAAPHEGEARAVEYVASRLDALGWELETVDAAPQRPSLVATGPGSGDAIVLAGHLDTVAVEGYDDPFSGRRADNRVYGRGACDMKAAMACYLEVAEILAAQGHDGQRLVIAAVADEEHEQLGAKAVRPVLPPTELLVIGEPTELRVCAAAKGLAAYTIRIEGVATHGSVPGAGANAIERAAELIGSLRAHAEELTQREHPLLGPGVLNIGAIRGGTRPNVVPPSCEIDVSRRLLPTETAASAREQLLQACGDGPWTISDSWWTVEPYENTDAGLIAKFFGDAEVTGFPASSDAPYFGPPVVIYGPGSLAQAHSLDEWVDLDELVAATNTYLSLVQQ